MSCTSKCPCRCPLSALRHAITRACIWHRQSFAHNAHTHEHMHAHALKHTHTHSAAGASICRWRWRTTRTLLTLTLLSMASWCCSTSMLARARLFAVYLLVCNCGRCLLAPCAVVSVCGCACACVFVLFFMSVSVSVSVPFCACFLSLCLACMHSDQRTSRGTGF